MLKTARHFLSLIRFSHTLFALPFTLLAAMMAWRLQALERPAVAWDPYGGMRTFSSGAEAETYAKGVVAADFDRPGDEDMVEKILKDFTDKGIKSSAAEIRKELEHALPVAKNQIMQT